MALALIACQSSRKEPVTLTFLDPEWSHDVGNRSPLSEAVLRDFTAQTGIRINHLPAPETISARLALTMDLLRKGSFGPDVYSIDVIWPGLLASQLIDLSQDFKSELLASDPEVAANYRVNGKLVAMPYHATVGVLYYRADLLHRYGYTHPPRTWDELDQMASHIQQGERARGQKDFWGFVWPGAASEALMCNALEWQASEGGGQMIESDKTISVDNPAAIRSWKRAASWVGRISPPGVLSYQEWDAINAFANSGRAAFFRGWTSDYLLTHARDGAISRSEGITSVPGSTGLRVATLGGSGLAISESSPHRAEALQLVHFLLQEKALSSRKLVDAHVLGSRELFELPLLLKAFPEARKGDRTAGAKVVLRPSSLILDKYDATAKAYVGAVHSVLTGETEASATAAALQENLTTITGLRTAPVRQNF